MAYTWAIGDIHGTAEALRAIIGACSKYPTEKFVFLGDYIDRGPDSKGVIDELLSLKTPWIGLIGNHEDLMLDYIDKGRIFKKYPDAWLANGGDFAYASFKGVTRGEASSEMEQGKDFNLEKRFMNFFRSLKYSHVDEYETAKGESKIAFVHAGFDPALPFEKWLSIKDSKNYSTETASIDIESNILWTRGAFLKCDPVYLKGYMVIHGHTPTPMIKRFINPVDGKDYNQSSLLPFVRFDDGQALSIDIDTGCYYGYRLTAIGLNPDSLDKGELLTIQAGFSEGKSYGDIKIIESVTPTRKK